MTTTPPILTPEQIGGPTTQPGVTQMDEKIIQLKFCAASGMCRTLTFDTPRAMRIVTVIARMRAGSTAGPGVVAIPAGSPVRLPRT